MSHTGNSRTRRPRPAGADLWWESDSEASRHSGWHLENHPPWSHVRQLWASRVSSYFKLNLATLEYSRCHGRANHKTSQKSMTTQARMCRKQLTFYSKRGPHREATSQVPKSRIPFHLVQAKHSSCRAIMIWMQLAEKIIDGRYRRSCNGHRPAGSVEPLLFPGRPWRRQWGALANKVH